METKPIESDEQFFYKVSLKGHDGRIWKPRYIFVNECDAITEANHYDKWFSKPSPPVGTVRMWEASIEKFDVMPEGILMFDALPNIYTGSQNCCPLPPAPATAKKTMNEIWNKVPVRNRVQDYLSKLAQKA